MLLSSSNSCRLIWTQPLQITTHIPFSLFGRLSEAQQKQEEYATNIEKFLNLIQTLNAHKAELIHKDETLTAEKATMEQQMEDCSKKIQQLRETIDGQELSQEDVRRMEREKARIEEQVAKQKGVLEGHVAALKESQEKWEAVYALLEQRVGEYNARAEQLELIPKTARYAKGHDFEVRLDENMAVESVVKMMGGVDIEGVVKPHVKKLVEFFASETLSEKRKLSEMKEQVESAEISNEQLVEDIEVRFSISCWFLGLEFAEPDSSLETFFFMINLPGHQRQNYVM